MNIKSSNFWLFYLGIFTASLAILMFLSESIVNSLNSLWSSILLFGIPTPQNYYFVAPTGSDDNPGTIERPFKTVQKCANVAEPGQTCLLRAGIYRETVRPAISGTTMAPVTFAAYKK